MIDESLRFVYIFGIVFFPVVLAMNIQLTTTRVPRVLCGTVGSVLFCVVAVMVNRYAIFTAFASIIYHILRPSCRYALCADLTANLITFIQIVPHIPYTSMLMIICVVVNWILHRVSMNEVKHVLQVTLPMFILCFTSTSQLQTRC